MRKRLKRWLKEKTARHPWLAGLFIFLYKISGRRPWSLGYNVYKFKKIKGVVETDLNSFRRGELPEGYGYALDERIIEYPWTFSRLKEGEKIILDAGASLNHGDILNLKVLRDRKVYISTLAYEHFFSGFPNTPSYIIEDLRNLNFRDEFFDAIICISTLEHIGKDNTFLYTSDQSKKESDPYAFLKAVKEFRRILKKDGTLYLTVPYGRHKNYQWFQVFDAEMISLIKKEFMSEQESETYFKYENRQWNYSTARECKDAVYFDIHKQPRSGDDDPVASQGVVCLELVKSYSLTPMDITK